MQKKNKPLRKEEEVQQSNDERIDQDYPGFPHHPANKKNITPKTPVEKKAADSHKTRSKKTYG